MTPVAWLRRIALRVRVAFGYIPNMEWFRANLNRATVLDRARAHAAITEMERCLALRRDGGRCLRLHALL